MILLACVGIYFGKTTYDSYKRPMFFNEHLGVGFQYIGWLFPGWRWPVPVIDKAGDIVLADYHLNILLVIASTERLADAEQQQHSTLQKWHAILRSATRNDVQVTQGERLVRVPRAENKLIVMRKDGDMTQCNLPEGEAKRCWFQCRRFYNSDLPGQLKSLLAENNVDAKLLLNLESPATQHVR